MGANLDPRKSVLDGTDFPTDVIHLDMDAFYASIEQRENPSLKGKPVIVGGSPESRGVVATCSYEARKFGVHSAMPSYRAKKLCPEAIFLPSNFSLYRKVSRNIRNIVTPYAERVEFVGLDEGFLAIDSDAANPVKLACQIKTDIKESTGLVCSIGLSINKPLAKLASDWEKPDGFCVFDSEAIRKKLPDIPLSKLWGVGPTTSRELARHKIETCGDFQKADASLIIDILGKSRAWDLALLCSGLYRDEVGDGSRSKSMSMERTFAHNVEDPRSLQEHVRLMCEELSGRMKNRGLKCSTITLKVRRKDFKDISRAKTLNESTDDKKILTRSALELLSGLFEKARDIRLLGISLSNFVYPDVPHQLSIYSFASSFE